MARKPKLALGRAFAPAILTSVYTRYVWESLRKQKCRDLLFYYDYRRAIEDRSNQLSATITRGNYRPRAGLPIAIARSDMLARNMHIPHPDDALVMQVISETLLPTIEAKKPSPNAVFARSHSTQSGLHKQSQDRIYPWFRLWPLYQERILKFASTKKFLVITDVQNFFDSVGFSYIRRRIGSDVPGSQQIIDLMLLQFENLIGRDMYAPIVLHGIPTIDVDAPRLVGHALLFPIDKYLKVMTGDCFARWMDDINFGVDSVDDAREAIREIDRRLRTIGLRLNGGKTRILSYSEARQYLEADENQRLNVIETAAKKRKGVYTLSEASRLARGLLRFSKATRTGYWDKVLRRYYGLNAAARRGLTKSSESYRLLLRKVEALSRTDFRAITTTEVRESIVRFWLTLPPTDARIRYYAGLLNETQPYDDSVTFALFDMLSKLILPARQSALVVKNLMKLLKQSQAPGFYFGSCWFLAKYGTQRDIVEFISRSTTLWEGNYFFARQAVSLWSLLDTTNAASRRLRDAFLRTHDADIASTIAFLESLQRVALPDMSLRQTLPSNKSMTHVDLSRAILSSNVMRSPNLDRTFRKWNSERIAALVQDKRLREIALGGTAK